MLVVSELVTNVVRHAHSHSRLTLRYADQRLRIEVSDESNADVQTEQTRGEEPGGWGIPIVAALTDRWGVERDSSGKTVWAEVCVHPSRPHRPDDAYL